VKWNHQNPTFYYISLILFDFHYVTLTKLNIVELKCRIFDIIVNKAEPTEFVIRFWFNHLIRICKVDGKDIVIGDLI
jgi:hypothetical protein